MIVAGLEDVPFAIQTVLAPYSALDITTLLHRTADELSRFASMVNGGESLNISISPGSLLTPLHTVMQQTVRSTGISHTERREALASQAHKLEASRGAAQTGWGRQSQVQDEFTAHTDTQYAAGANINEQLSEHEEAAINLKRNYADRYSVQKTFAGTEQATVETAGQVASTVQGERAQQTQTASQAQETGALNSRETADTAISGQRGASGNRSGAGNRMATESYRVGGQTTTVERTTHASDLQQATQSAFGEQTLRNTQGASEASATTASNGGRTQAFAEHSSGDAAQTFQRDFDHAAELATESTRATETTAAGISARSIPIAEGERTQQVQHTGNLQQSREQGTQNGATAATSQENQVGSGTSQYASHDQQASQQVSHEVQQHELAGQRTNNQVQNIEGTTTQTTVATQSGGGTRSANEAYGYHESYQFSENFHEQAHREQESQRNWVSDVDRSVAQQSASDWTQATGEQSNGVVRTMKAYGGSYQESGVRRGQLTQQDFRVTDRELTRATRRQENGWRAETQQGESTHQQAEQGSMEMQQQQLSTGEAYQRTQAQGAASETGSFAGHSQSTTRGYAGPSGAGLFVGLGSSRQIKDNWRELLVTLLTQQQERLMQGRNAGFFHNQTVLMAPSKLILARLIGAAVAAWREDSSVTPLAIRQGDKALWEQAVRFALDQRREENPIHPYAFRQALTTNEISSLVHPIRIEGKGGSTSSLNGWPDVLGLSRETGELEFGYQISPATDATTDLVLRVAYRDLMHMLIVGASGSGKSNSALHIVAQIINRLRENEHGQRQPVPLTGALHVQTPETGRPAMGVTVLDPTGEWRRLAHMLFGTEFHFYSLTNAHHHHLGFNPVAIPSPHITPKSWISAFAKRWAMAYATGATGVSLMRKAMQRLYQQHEVFAHPEHSQRLTMVDLYAEAEAVFTAMKRQRSIDNISPGVLKRILDKMQEFQPGGLHYEAFGNEGTATVEDWLWPYGATVIEGNFGDDEMLKSFIIGLLGVATYQHSEGKYKANIEQRGTLTVRRQLLVFEEAHVIMQGGQKTQLQSVLEKTAGLWDHIADRGRKFGLYTLTVAQHWLGLPEGIVGSARVVIAQGVNTLEDAEAAAAAVGFRPGRSSMDEVTQVIDKLLDMPVGCGIVKRKRLPKNQEARQKAIAVQFPDISAIEPPTDGQLARLTEHATVNAHLQRQLWQDLPAGFTSEQLLPPRGEHENSETTLRQNPAAAFGCALLAAHFRPFLFDRGGNTALRRFDRLPR